MVKLVKKSKMTIDKLARITQDEFVTVRKDMHEGFTDVRKDMHEGFVGFRKDIAEEVRDIMREGNVKIISSNEKVASKLDEFLKDRAAHDSLHKRITDDFHSHDQRIKKVEAKI